MIAPDPLLLAAPFIDRLSDDGRHLMQGRVRPVTIAAGQTILQPGDEVGGAYFVARGSIRVFYLDQDGREGTLYTIAAGQSCILALNCLFARMEYPAWAEAGEGGVELYQLDSETAHHLMALDPEFLNAMFTQVSTRLYGLLATLEQAIRLPLKGRLITLLLRMAGADGEVRLSQQKIAAHLGSSREVISRLLKSLSAEGLVEVSYGKVAIVDQAMLEGRIS